MSRIPKNKSRSSVARRWLARRWPSGWGFSAPRSSLSTWVGAGDAVAHMPEGFVSRLTRDGELRLWGRGYGSRLPLADARVEEKLVDLYAGRLGAWRERRLTVSSGSREIEFGTLASDEDQDLPLIGGEGDCVEFDREDYLRLRTSITAGRTL